MLEHRHLVLINCQNIKYWLQEHTTNHRFLNSFFNIYMVFIAVTSPILKIWNYSLFPTLKRDI